MTAQPVTGVGQPEVEAARLLLARLGVSVADLVGSPETRPVVPTFADYVPVVSGAVSDGCRRAYGSYWKRVLEQWATRRLDAIRPSDIEWLVEYVKSHAVQRRNARGGRSAAENLIAALRCLYNRAVADGYVAAADNPARKVAKPQRLASGRHAIADARLAEIYAEATSTGDDPALDGLLLRLHTETACRRGGALALRPVDLDEQQCLVRLREKGGTQRWQPVSPTLMRHLVQHAGERQAPPVGQLLRYRDGRPITYRRYDHVWERVGRQLPWVATRQISTHWLRYTILTWVERTFGYAVARRYAGHAEGGDAGATATYVCASLEEVAEALAALTGEPHPLAGG